MNELQLAAIGKSLVRVTKIPTSIGLTTVYRAPGMDLDRETVRYWADYSTSWPKWPELPPQHGMPGNQERYELKAFTALVVALGLAEPPRGPEPARWVVSMKEIYNQLDLT